MSQALQQAFQNFITPSRIEKLKVLLGDEPDQIESTLQHSFFSVMEGIVKKSLTSEGANTIVNAARNAYDNNMLDDVDTIFAGGGEWTHTGGRLLNNIFGADENTVAQKISDQTGAKKSSVHNILIIAALLITGLIGKNKTDGKSLYGSLTGTPLVAASTAYAVAPTEKKGSGWLIPLLIFLALIAIAWWLLKDKKTEAPVIETPATDTMVVVKQSIIDTVNRTVKLPNDSLFHVSHGTMEYKLVQFLNNPDSKAGKDIWFDFDDVNFDLDKATLTAESAVQLDNIAAILKAYSHVKVKVGGYTDKTGKEDHNMQLSQERADTISHALAARGIPAEQLTGAEGYGSQFATQPATASDAARRVDRRMSLSVREK